MELSFPLLYMLLFSAFLACSPVPAVISAPLMQHYRYLTEQGKLRVPETCPVLLRYQPSTASLAASVFPRQGYSPTSYRLAVTSEAVVMTTVQQAPAPVLYPRLSKTLDSLAYVDQWPMQRMFRQQPDTAGRRLDDVEKENFARHQPLLEKIVQQVGFPGFRQVGNKSSSNFWLLVQHADAYPKFQRRVLKLMRPEVKRKNANAFNYAYLIDRVAKNTGHLSEYGTQVDYQGSGPAIQAVSRPLRDPAHVNQRRAAVGLEPLENYLDSMTKMTREMNAPKTPPNSSTAPVH